MGWILVVDLNMRFLTSRLKTAVSGTAERPWTRTSAFTLDRSTIFGSKANC